MSSNGGKRKVHVFLGEKGGGGTTKGDKVKIVDVPFSTRKKTELRMAGYGRKRASPNFGGGTSLNYHWGGKIGGGFKAISSGKEEG